MSTETLVTSRPRSSGSAPEPDARRHHAAALGNRADRWQRVVVTDVVALALASLVGGAIRISLYGPREGPSSEVATAGTEWPYIGWYVAAFCVYGLYHRHRRRVRPTAFPDLSQFGHALAAGTIAILVVSGLMHRWFEAPRIGWVEGTLTAIPAFAFVALGRSLVVCFHTRRGRVRSRVVVVGAGPVAQSVADRLDSCEDIRILGFVDDAGGNRSLRFPVLAPLAHLADLCRSVGVDRLVLAIGGAPPPALTDSLRDLPAVVQVSVVPEPYELLTPRSVVEEVRGVTLIDVAPQDAGGAQRALKRALDVTVSLGLLAVLTPAWIVAAIAIKVGSPGPVLFRQLRSGRHGRPFVIYKFRSMRLTTESDRIDLTARNEVDGPLFKIRDDPRTTKAGRFLRATSLDELPQLLNVLKGDMSLVGPRPFVCHEAEKIDGWAARRFDVRPGMTGLWQVSGRNDLPYEELRRLDYVYVASWSLWWDLKILWQTPGSVTARRGAY